MPQGYFIVHVPTRFAATGETEMFLFSLNATWFTVLVFIVGVCMGIGKAAVYKYIPEYFPYDVGAVGGLVGMLGALGGFFLPPMFASILELTWLPQTTFFVLFIITTISYMWLHWTVVHLLQKASPTLENELDFRDVPQNR